MLMPPRHIHALPLPLQDQTPKKSRGVAVDAQIKNSDCDVAIKPNTTLYPILR
jgi:hypothetical protein